MSEYKNRWYQDECEYAIFEYFKNNKEGNPIAALPTGTGKSVIIGNFIKKVLQTWPGQRIIMLTHVKKLIEQNAEKLQSVWPEAPLGIYSAGLNSRDRGSPVIFGGVQSVFKAIEKSTNSENIISSSAQHFSHRDLVIIDECHMLGPNDNARYNIVINALKKINPKLRVIGFTATPYRLGQGMLVEPGSLFNDICYDITGVQSFNRLIAENFLAPLIPKRTDVEIDVSGISMSNSTGDFNNKQLEKQADKVSYEAVKQTVECGQDRKCWLVFTAGVEHCDKVTAMLQSFGISAVSCHSKIKDKHNDKNIEDFKNGKFQCMVNANKLTTGFDCPQIDLIVMLRPTLSAALWVQMLGRGTRPFEGKENCLVLDFARNTPRLGPINDPIKPNKPGKGGGDAPIRICDSCGTYNHASARQCICCGMEFSFETKIFAKAGSEELIKSESPIVEFIEVQKVIYNLYEKKNADPTKSKPMMRVSYFCGLRMFTEMVCFEHGGYPTKKAHDWWNQRHETEPPATTAEALKYTAQLRTPKHIKVWLNKKYPEILGVEW